MRATDAWKFKGIGSGNTPAFSLFGGLYQVVAVGFTGGTVTMNQLAPDGVTYLSVLGPWNQNGGCTIYLPPGVYLFTVVNETNLSMIATRVPGD